MESRLAVMDGLTEETMAATSEWRSQTTGWPARYSQEDLALSMSTGWPRLSSFPLPCQVTSAVEVPSLPNTTQAWSSDSARWIPGAPSSWQAATTAKATPKQSSLFPVR